MAPSTGHCHCRALASMAEADGSHMCMPQVTAEGGRDAAIEAPFIYMALDQLALRAKARMLSRGVD